MTKTLKIIETAWDNAAKRVELTPLMVAVREAIKKAPYTQGNFRGGKVLMDFAKRIAHTEKRGKIAALEYQEDVQGEWYVANRDLLVFSDFRLWLGRFAPENSTLEMEVTSDIRRALKKKRLQQALDRYKQTGLTKEHCLLLQKLLWEVDINRSDWISIFVQGKRPFGNSAIESDIYDMVGWPMPWLDDEAQEMTEEQDERAWNLFDELIFAAPDAAKLALKNL